MKKPKKESALAIVKDLAKCPIEQHRHNDGRPRTWSLNPYGIYDAYKISVRARRYLKSLSTEAK